MTSSDATANSTWTDSKTPCPPITSRSSVPSSNAKLKPSGPPSYQCDTCGKPHLFFRSCGNRHCPSCQNHKTHQWLHKQMKRQVPGHHFLVTFTTPQQLHPFIRSNQRTSYNAMFTASSQAMTTLAADPKYL